MGTEFVATAGPSNIEHKVRILSLGDRFIDVEVDGDALRIDAVRIDERRWSVLVGNSSHIVHFPSRDGGPVLSGTAFFSLVVEDARRRILGATAAGDRRRGEIVRAPIAGRVVAYLVDVGTEVAQGDRLCVLEAMKMENEIRATRGGRVVTLHADVGASVDTNAKLLSLE